MQQERVPVLFLQSQEYFGSDSMIQSLLARGLNRERFEVHVACSPGTSDSPSASWKALSQIEDIRLVPINFGPSIFAKGRRELASAVARGVPAIAGLPKLVAYAKRHNIRVVHGTEKPRDALTAVMLAKLTRAKSVVHLHVKCHDGLSKKQTFALRHSDAILGVSRFVADSVVAKGYDPGKVFHIVNGLDADAWDASSYESSLDLEQEFNLPPGAQVITIASRLFYWKGHNDLLQALARIAASHPLVTLLIVGDDDPRAHPGSGKYSDQLKLLARDLGIADRVRFTGFRSDVRDILAGSDIYAMPTFEEPCAVAFLEAMAMGKAIVALESGGTPEMITNGSTGLLSGVGDIEALAANLATLLENPAERERLGSNAAVSARTYYTPERMCQDLEAIYGQILQPGVSAKSPEAAAV